MDVQYRSSSSCSPTDRQEAVITNTCLSRSDLELSGGDTSPLALHTKKRLRENTQMEGFHLSDGSRGREWGYCRIDFVS